MNCLFVSGKRKSGVIADEIKNADNPVSKKKKSKLAIVVLMLRRTFCKTVTVNSLFSITCLNKLILISNLDNVMSFEDMLGGGNLQKVKKVKKKQVSLLLPHYLFYFIFLHW